MRVQANHNGVRMDVDIDVDIANAIKCGGWEQCERDRVDRFLPDIDVIELGGGLGYIACCIGKKIPNRKHIVLESNNAFIPVIQRHMKLNKVNFELIHGHYPEVSITSIIQKYNIGDFALVADIEGFESNVILDEFDSLDRCKMAIIEFHPGFNNRVMDAYNKLISSGFEEIEKCPCLHWVGVYKNVR